MEQVFGRTRMMPWVLAVVLAIPPGAVGAEEPVDFDREVWPVLQNHCVRCHGGVHRQGGFSLLDRRGVVAPARSGAPPLVPGEPHASELVRRVRSSNPALRMPRRADPLSEDQIETLERWIEQGAVWPEHWAFTTIRSPALPEVENKSWLRNPIDRFVLARLEAAGVAPSPEADRRILARRLSLDLVGLPPSPDELEAFVRDNSPEAYEHYVDRLLASPHFGERWGRHWLDLARYADTDGYEVDGDRPNAWYWRDWVINAINSDMPFDRFTLEQLAGDLLPEATPDQHLATAFHRQTLTNKEGGVDQEEYRVAAIIDRVNTTAAVWLGLTMDCVQCHDHPYDPLRQREFYQLYAFFNNADESTFRVPSEGEAEYQREREEHSRLVQELREQLERAPEAQQSELEEQLKALEKKAPRDPAIQLEVMAERAEPRITLAFHRGNFLEPLAGDAIPPATPAVLPPLRARRTDTPADRLDLARWLVDPEHPLTARVAVNHIWQHLFGLGLVRSGDEFGKSGEPPTHPELLDWLAREFVRGQWSRKQLIRLVVTSATYRQSSVHRPELVDLDPENRLLHRQNRFRVEGEIVRDLHLAASGLLSRKIGGPSVFPPFPQDLAQIDFRSDLRWKTSTGEDRYRRGLYTFFKRTLPYPNLMVFDCPKADATAIRRDTSNTPLQALTTLNNEVFVEAAQALGEQLVQHVSQDEARIDLAYQRCLGRSPTNWERSRLLDLVAAYRQWYSNHPDSARQLAGTGQDRPLNEAELAVWTGTASVILNLDEFITRE